MTHWASSMSMTGRVEVKERESVTLSDGVLCEVTERGQRGNSTPRQIWV